VLRGHFALGYEKYFNQVNGSRIVTMVTTQYVNFKILLQFLNWTRRLTETNAIVVEIMQYEIYVFIVNKELFLPALQCIVQEH
jgi:hypothetical protein